MGKDSKIEWTHHTFNPWWGCTRASDGCANCYAETWANRVGEKVWGKNASRRFFGEDHWRGPLRWNREAAKSGERRRVFCASMADVFEDRRDLDSWREQLWGVIKETPWLDWLLVTKRAESVKQLTPWGQDWPGNVWLGATSETQEWAARRIPAILELPAAVHFVSCEPLLGALDLTPWLNSDGLDWVIAGGESGAKARPMNPTWVEDLQRQCQDEGVSFFFKQWGTYGADEVKRNKKDNGKVLLGREMQELPL